MYMKKALCLIMTVAFAFGVAACSSQVQMGVAPMTSEEESKTSEGASASRIVMDVWGREVDIPEKVRRIVCLGSGAPRLAAYLGVMDMVVGAEAHDVEAMTALRDYSPVYQKALASLPVVGAGGGSGENNGFPEELITLAPDVILVGFSQEAAEELQGQTNIPVVAVRYISNGLANESFYQAMRVFGETVGAEERCEEVLAFIDECKADLNGRTEDLPDEEKLRAYTGAVTFSGRHGFGGTYSNFGPFTAVNAVNVADEAREEGYYEADFEKIIVWDPDVIFLDPGNMDLVNDEYAKNPGYFDALRAVREGRIHTMPSFNNCGMNISYALMNAYYAGTVLFPQQFADVDIAEKSAEILTVFLGENTFDTMAEDGLYYGSTTIGA